MNLREMFRERADQPDSAYAWLRLSIAVLIGMIGGVGMWSVPVALPAVQADFGVDRAAASLPYTLTMVGFAVSGVGLGRLVDRFGISTPLAVGAAAIGIGYIAASFAPNIYIYAIVQGVLVGGGVGGIFRSAHDRHLDVVRAPARNGGRHLCVGQLHRRRDLAEAAGLRHCDQRLETDAHRRSDLSVSPPCCRSLCSCGAGRRLLASSAPRTGVQAPRARLSPNALTGILCVAGVACCVAMAMPQVHIVAYCGDLGYGVARGAEMLSLMLGFGIVSRLASGFIADKIGGVGTLLLGSTLQGVALVLYFFFDGMMSLYVISALFGLFQGGIVPSYAIIVREYFSPKEAGTRLGIVLMATLFGMALGGWMSGAIFDLTGSYRAAFANGIAFNVLNIAIALWLLTKPGRFERTLARA